MNLSHAVDRDLVDRNPPNHVDEVDFDVEQFLTQLK